MNLNKHIMPLLKSLLLIVIVLPLAVLSQSTIADTSFLKMNSSQKAHTQTTPHDTVVIQSARLGIANYYLLGKDNFKRQALFPFYLRGKDWVKLGAYTVVSGAIAFANQPIKTYAVNLRQNNPGIATVSRYVTRFGDPYIKYILGAGVAAGLLSKNPKLETTTLLASQAYFIANLLGGAVKILTGVQAPFYTDPFTHQTEPVFRGPLYVFKKTPDGQPLRLNNYGSFPSGHTYSAFAVATVFAMQYKNKPIVPIVAYGIATLVGLSRLTENRHWAMDIIPGALLGYYSGRQVVNNYRRFNKEKRWHKKKSSSLSFNLQYTNKQVRPGLVVRW